MDSRLSWSESAVELGAETRICPDANGGLPKCGERVSRVNSLPSPLLPSETSRGNWSVGTGELRAALISVGLAFLRGKQVSRAALHLLILLLAKLLVCSRRTFGRKLIVCTQNLIEHLAKRVYFISCHVFDVRFQNRGPE